MSYKGQFSLDSFELYNLARQFRIQTYRLIKQLPQEEKYCLGNQMRRAAVSVTNNIAEGHGRFYFQDNVRFCYIARGSLEETLSHINYAFKVAYLTDTFYKNLAADGENLNRLINGYIGFLKKSKQGANEPGANYAIREVPSDYIIETSEASSSDSNIE